MYSYRTYLRNVASYCRCHIDYLFVFLHSVNLPLKLVSTDPLSNSSTIGNPISHNRLPIHRLFFHTIRRRTLRHHLLHRQHIRLARVQRHFQTNPVHGAVACDASRAINAGDGFFAAGVDEEADEVRPHVVAAKVGEGFGEVTFV